MIEHKHVPPGPLESRVYRGIDLACHGTLQWYLIEGDNATRAITLRALGKLFDEVIEIVRSLDQELRALVETCECLSGKPTAEQVRYCGCDIAEALGAAAPTSPSRPRGAAYVNDETPSSSYRRPAGMDLRGPATPPTEAATPLNFEEKRDLLADFVNWLYGRGKIPGHQHGAVVEVEDTAEGWAALYLTDVPADLPVADAGTSSEEEPATRNSAAEVRLTGQESDQ